MRLILVSPHAELCQCWSTAFAPWQREVSVAHARFEELSAYDALVAPGNSFGVMDGGIDAAIVDRFPAVHEAVRAAIDTRWRGYQPVGTTSVVATGDSEHPHLVHAPTMRVPMRLPPELRINVHDAFWAALVAVERHNESEASAGIETLAVPGLGTGVGGVPAKDAASLMAIAYRSFRDPSPTGPRASFDREAALSAASGR